MCFFLAEIVHYLSGVYTFIKEKHTYTDLRANSLYRPPNTTLCDPQQALLQVITRGEKRREEVYGLFV